MSLLQSEMLYGKWYVIDGDCGTETVPGEYIDENVIKNIQTSLDSDGSYGLNVPDELSTLCNHSEISDIEILEGYGVSLSSSEAFEHNQWEIFQTEEEAKGYIKEYLLDYFGETNE